MRRDTRTNTFNSSFMSCEKDIETILKKLFVESQPYSNMLKRLLVINTKDCLENDSEAVMDIIDNCSLSKLVKEGYIKLEPKIQFEEHEEVKAYIVISLDNFTSNSTNEYYRDCTVNFDVIDGILNEAKLSGIGTFNFLGCNELILDERLSGYTLSYRAIHGNDDNLPPKEED